MRNAVAELYQLADKYFIPREEIALWLQDHVKKLSYSYTIPSHELEMFKDSLESIERVHEEKGKRLLIDAANVKKKEELNSFGKTVTLTLGALV